MEEEKKPLKLLETQTIHHEVDYPDWEIKLLEKIIDSKVFSVELVREGDQFNLLINYQSQRSPILLFQKFALPSRSGMSELDWKKAREKVITESITWWIDYIMNHG
jgi:hypothetical protein